LAFALREPTGHAADALSPPLFRSIPFVVARPTYSRQVCHLSWRDGAVSPSPPPPPTARDDPLHNHRRALALDTCHRKTVLPASRRVRYVPRVKRDVIFRGVPRGAEVGTCAGEESTPRNVERARTLGSHHVALPGRGVIRASIVPRCSLT